MNILVLCENIVVSGGLLRFEKMAKILNKLSDNLYFFPLLGKNGNHTIYNSKIINQNELDKIKWDMVFVPGAGFSDEIIEKFSRFKNKKYGLRVQFILNDITKKDKFLKVNRAFNPDVVVFNNNWKIGTFTDLMAKQFHFIIGAVDTMKFYPEPFKPIKNINDTILIGGQVHKNPWPLFEALKILPDNFKLCLFGHSKKITSQDTYGRYKYLQTNGRIKFEGILDENALVDYYKKIDIVVSTETFAGWSNISAEALASGIPLVCTKHGTENFAKDGDTALIIENLKPDLIAKKITNLFNNSNMLKKIVSNGRKEILDYDWHEYIYKLKNILNSPISHDYVYLPEKSLYGKWPVSTRLQGLMELIKISQGKTILDLGMAEGIIANEFLKFDAKYIVGFELSAQRVKKAMMLNKKFKNKTFASEDLNDWEALRTKYKEYFNNKFDIVLYLGIHHHLDKSKRIKILNGLISISKEYIAIRTPENEFAESGIDRILNKNNFLLFLQDHNQTSNSGVLKIYKKVKNG